MCATDWHKSASCANFVNHCNVPSSFKERPPLRGVAPSKQSVVLVTYIAPLRYYISGGGHVEDYLGVREKMS